MTVNEAIQIATQHHRAGRLAEAESIYRQVLGKYPDHPHTLHMLGLLAGQNGDFNTAVDLIRKAVTLQPNQAEGYYNLGIALHGTAQAHESIACFRRAILLKPDYAAAHYNLGLALHETGLIDEAIASYRRTIRLCPDLVEAHSNLGVALKDIGQFDEAIAACRHAAALRPDSPALHSSLLLTLYYQPSLDARAIRIESERWNQRHAEPLKQLIKPHANDRNTERKLRIGYISPDFHDHPVSRFVLPLLAAHDRLAFEKVAYSESATFDAITKKVKECCESWRSISGVSDDGVAEMIRADRIDILIDLAGHTAGNRLPVFARKPAPVQVTWLGYPGTTGLSEMDYRFTDALADPPGQTDSFCTEQLLRLPQTVWCYQPPDDAPPVNQLPAMANGRVTFGSFNNFAKVNEPLLNLWAGILRAAPSAKLLLKAKPLRSASIQNRVRHVMSDEGIQADRLELLGWASSADYMSHYHRVDIALDTYPYHGTTTTCESLWMGVPVVTLAGESHVSRVGASLLTSVGLPELVVDTPEQYVRRAADLASDLSRLAELRHMLRARMRASPLMDATRFARDVEAAYRQMWRKWCEKAI